jgi:hypothetical protein
MYLALLGLAPTLTEIECIIAQLYAAGFPFADISILLRVEAPEDLADGEPCHVNAEGIIRLLAENSLHTSRDGHHFLVGGPMGTALTSLAEAGLAHCLSKFGVPPEQASAYVSMLPHGAILLSVQTERSEAEHATEILRLNGAHTLTEIALPKEFAAGSATPG